MKKTTKSGNAAARKYSAYTKRSTGRELAEDLARVNISPAEARLWHRQLAVGRKTLKTPDNKWK